MLKINLSTIGDIIRSIAVEQIMPRFRKLAEGDVEMKSANDPVTVADKEAERYLSEQLQAYLPGSVVVGEESFAKDTAIMDHIGGTPPVWIIDPIDGTRNFVAGIPEFAVMVALVDKKKTVAAWIHDPNSGDMIMAEQGGGVWLRDKKLRLAGGDPSVPTVGLVGARVKKLISDPSVMPQGKDLPPIEIGSCAGFDYPRLFSGEANFANSDKARAGFLFYRHTNAWDHVPGIFLHSEAGGYNANWSGELYDMTDRLSGLLFAPDRESWAWLHALFEPLIQHTLQKAP